MERKNTVVSAVLSGSVLMEEKHRMAWRPSQAPDMGSQRESVISNARYVASGSLTAHDLIKCRRTAGV